jgi:homocysteine S-methyltransferase
VPRSFLDAIDRRVLVCDGAMGTMLYSRGIFLNRCFDELNLTHPDLVAEVHQAYVRAGADVIETNTFGANRIKLAGFGLSDQLAKINDLGAKIARQAARDQAFVAGAIGPIGIRVEPWGKTGLDEAEAWFREQASALLAGGVDLFILETFRDINELGAAVRAVRAVSALPVVAQLTTEEDGNSLDGTPPEVFTPRLEAFGADVIGVNCSVGPAAMLETLERMASASQARLSAQPNAGRPRDVDGRNLYLSSPEYLASYARRFVRSGVRLVGGCCGTTPEHISHIRRAVGTTVPASPTAGRATAASGTAPAVEPIDRAQKSRMANALSRGAFVRVVSVVPPRGHRPDDLIEQARALKIRGVDVLQIADAATGTRMSGTSAAVLIEQQVGIETLLTYTCRDHRLLGMQSDLLGAHAMGIRNLLLTTGDPLRVGDHQDATLVFDVDSIGLTNAVTRLNHGSDVGGQPLGPPTAFHVGVAVNPTALNLDDEIRRYHYKIDAGAEFIVTHPVFDPADLEAFVARVGGIPVPLIAGLRPLDGPRQAETLANEVPGTRVPAAMVERLAAADADGRAAEEGVAITRDLLAAIRPLVQGVQLAVAPSRIGAAVEVLTALDQLV